MLSSKNKLQHIQLSDMSGTSNGTGFYGQMKQKNELLAANTQDGFGEHRQWRAQASGGAGAKLCYEGPIVDPGRGVYEFWTPRLGMAKISKLFLFFLYHDSITILCLFCKLFEHYSQTNVPIIKTKPYKGNKILKSMTDI